MVCKGALILNIIFKFIYGLVERLNFIYVLVERLVERLVEQLIDFSICYIILNTNLKIELFSPLLTVILKLNTWELQSIGYCRNKGLPYKRIK